MEITKYLPFRCIIFVSESTFIVGVRLKNVWDFIGISFFFQGHEFSPMIYNYDERKGTIEFVEKLDQQEGTAGKQAVGLESRISFDFSFDHFYIEKKTSFLRHIRHRTKDKRVCVCSGCFFFLHEFDLDFENKIYHFIFSS